MNATQGGPGASNVATGGQIWVRKLDRRVTLYFENLIVADTKDALCAIEIHPDLQEPVLYLPRRDVISELAANGQRETCKIKGLATYFDLLGTDDTVIVQNAAWSYPDPTPKAVQIRDYIAFNNRFFIFEDVPL